jgi:hypothetical protein
MRGGERKSYDNINGINDHGKTKTKIERPPAVPITFALAIPIMPDHLNNATEYEYNEGSIDEDIK